MVYIHMWWTGRFPTQPWRRPVTIWVYKPEATNSLELLMMSGVPLETCWAFNKLWNNKFYYKAASCWYFYWVKMEIVFYMPLTKRKLLWRGTTLNSMHVGYYPSGEIWRSRSGISDDSKPCGVWCRVSTEAVGESSASLSPYNLLLPRPRHQVASTKVLSHNWPKMLGRHMGAPLLFSTYALQPSKDYCAIWVRRSNFRHQASPRVSPRESTQRRKVEVWARNVRKFCLYADFHVTFRDLLHAVKLRHGTDGFTSPPKEAVLRIFSP